MSARTEQAAFTAAAVLALAVVVAVAAAVHGVASWPCLIAGAVGAALTQTPTTPITTSKEN